MTLFQLLNIYIKHNYNLSYLKDSITYINSIPKYAIAYCFNRNFIIREREPV